MVTHVSMAGATQFAAPQALQTSKGVIMSTYKLMSNEQKALLVEDRAELLTRISHSRDVSIGVVSILGAATCLLALCVELALNILNLGL